MEIKRDHKDQVLLHGDVRLPEIIDSDIKGPSRAKVLFHLTGMGLGFLFLLVGLGMGLSRSMWDKLALIPIITGGALVLGWITVNYRFMISVVRNRRVMVGTNAVFMGLLGLTLLFAANFVAYRHYRKWDMTVAGKFTLSPKTEKVLSELKGNVEIITVTLQRVRTGQEEAATRLQGMLKLYTEHSKSVSAKFLQPDIDPTAVTLLTQKYGISLQSPNDYDTAYVISGAKKKAVHLREIMDYQRDPENPYGPMKPTTFKGEQLITSAILEVTEAAQPKVYFLSGHGEKDISDVTPPGMLELANNLKRDNILVETLSGVTSSGVPADCDALIIMAPQAVFAREDVDRIRQYLGRGGRIFIAQDVGKNSGLEGLMAEWGIRFGNDAVISQDAQTALGSPVAFVATAFADHEITKSLKGFQVIFNFARSVSAMPDQTGRIEAAPLIQTTKNSYAETDVNSLFKSASSTKDPKADTMGPITLAVAAQEKPGEQGEGKAAAKTARIVAFGNAAAFANDILAQPVKNLDLARNAVNWLLDRHELIAIDARPEARHAIAVDRAAVNAVFYFVVLAMPLLVLLMGGFVWALRSYGSRSK